MGLCSRFLKKKKQAMNKNFSIPLAIIAAGLIIGAAVYFTRDAGTPDNNDQDANAVSSQNQEQKVPEITADDHILGNPDASISYFIYSDLQCPYCRNFHSTIKQIISDYVKNGKVKIIFRHFPLSSLHPKAEELAQGAECSAKIGGEQKFWDFMDKLIETNSVDALETAGDINIDKNKFEECVKSGEFGQKIIRDTQAGIDNGVQGTPHSIIVKDGKPYPIVGALPYFMSDSQLYNALEEWQRKIACMDDGKTCGIKIAVDKILSE